MIPNTKIEFLNYKNKLDKGRSNILDQNIRGSIDVRTYRVKFEKIKNFSKVV